MIQEQLLQPRYEVIADYPFMNQYDVFIGKIYSHDWDNKQARINGDAFSTLDLSKYPHLFRKLEWWEKRDIKDMPEYVKCIKTPDQKHFPDVVYKVDNSIVLNTNCYLPATEQEYTLFLNELNNEK